MNADSLREALPAENSVDDLESISGSKYRSWSMSDDGGPSNCTICNVKFQKRTLTRRYNCRICGACVCSGCAPSTLVDAPKESGEKGSQRACRHCVVKALRVPMVTNSLLMLGNRLRDLADEPGVETVPPLRLSSSPRQQLRSNSVSSNGLLSSLVSSAENFDNDVVQFCEASVIPLEKARELHIHTKARLEEVEAARQGLEDQASDMQKACIQLCRRLSLLSNSELAQKDDAGKLENSSTTKTASEVLADCGRYVDVLDEHKARHIATQAALADARDRTEETEAALAEERQARENTESALILERQSRQALEEQVQFAEVAHADERQKREATEVDLVNERMKREAVDAALAQEQNHRQQAEAAHEEEKMRRTEAEAAHASEQQIRNEERERMQQERDAVQAAHAEERERIQQERDAVQANHSNERRKREELEANHAYERQKREAVEASLDMARQGIESKEARVAAELKTREQLEAAVVDERQRREHLESTLSKERQKNKDLESSLSEERQSMQAVQLALANERETLKATEAAVAAERKSREVAEAAHSNHLQTRDAGQAALDSEQKLRLVWEERAAAAEKRAEAAVAQSARDRQLMQQFQETALFLCGFDEASTLGTEAGVETLAKARKKLMTIEVMGSHVCERLRATTGCGVDAPPPKTAEEALAWCQAVLAQLESMNQLTQEADVKVAREKAARARAEVQSESVRSACTQLAMRLQDLTGVQVSPNSSYQHALEMPFDDALQICNAVLSKLEEERQSCGMTTVEGIRIGDSRPREKTDACGAGSGMNAPAHQAIVPELSLSSTAPSADDSLLYTPGRSAAPSTAETEHLPEFTGSPSSQASTRAPRAAACARPCVIS